jgi:hypothetical protein
MFKLTKNNGDFRLIHNLSQPAEKSVNDFIDSKFCFVRYLSIDDAVRLVKRIGHAKADVKSAYPLLRVSPSDFDQLGFIFNNKYYYDKCLPMGASISCSLFEKFSTALHWFTEIKSGNENILHYLDDFLYGGETNTSTCKETLDTFDTIRMELRLPKEKPIAIKSYINNIYALKKDFVAPVAIAYWLIKLRMSGCSPWKNLLQETH